MRRFIYILLSALVGVAVAGGLRFFFPRETVSAQIQSGPHETVGREPGEDLLMRKASTGVVVSESDPAPLYPLSVTRRGLTALVTLSDGTRRWYDPRYPAQSDGIEVITPSYVQIDGEKLYFRSPVSMPAPRAGVQSSALVPPPINLDLPPVDSPPLRLPMPQSAPADAPPGTGLPPGTFAPSRL